MVDMSLEKVMEVHTDKWEEIWSNGSIFVDGDIELAHTVIGTG